MLIPPVTNLGLLEQPGLELTLEEAVKLGAIDSDFYCRTFFPKAYRQRSPEFDKRAWDILEDDTIRYANLKVFRGGAKTTRARTFTSKRIAYGVSRTILYVGASETAAVRSSHWLRNNVVKNQRWAGAFGLSKGTKWTDTEFEIEHATFGHTVWLTFVGITGNIRGINFDDYRPDLIVLDDILTDENCATEEQREKINDLVQTALRASLAPRVDEPNAKMVMLATPQHSDDAAHKCEVDPLWATLNVPCWTEETLLLPVAQQKSVWPERYPDDELRKEKLSFISRNELSKFIREYEVRLVSRESASFRAEWLKSFTSAPPTTNVLSIDPVPPPSESQLAKGLSGKDYEVIQVWGRAGDDYYLQESAASRGHTPDWTITTALGLAIKWRVTQIVVESVAYQRTLKWLLEQEMQRRRIWFIINAYQDRRPKYARIQTTFATPASQGKIFVNPEVDTEFLLQFETFPSCDHDDQLDAGAMALSVLLNPWASGATDKHGMAEVETLKFKRRAP